MRDRTITWMEGKAVEVLGKKKVITSYLALSCLVLESVRSLKEQANLDIAVQKLISRKLISCQKDRSGLKTYILKE